jgi:hypothetical protein
VARATGFRPQVPVFGLTPPEPAVALRTAIDIASLIWHLRGDCRLGVLETVPTGFQRVLLPDDARVSVFDASGAIDATITSASSRGVLADDAAHVDRKAVLDQVRAVVAKLTPDLQHTKETIAFERMFERRIQGVPIRRGAPTPVALVEVVAAFRRFVDGVPVLGRASLHVGVGAGNRVTKWGRDWRHCAPTQGNVAKITPVDDAAHRLIAVAQRRHPGRALGLKDFTPTSMTLGYLSLPRRQAQAKLLPAWVAQFTPNGFSSMGMVLAVAASDAPGHAIDLTPHRRR